MAGATCSHRFTYPLLRKYNLAIRRSLREALYGMLSVYWYSVCWWQACGVGLSVNTDADGNTILDVSLPETVVNEIIKGAVTSDTPKMPTPS